MSQLNRCLIDFAKNEMTFPKKLEEYTNNIKFNSQLSVTPHNTPLHFVPL